MNRFDRIDKLISEGLLEHESQNAISGDLLDLPDFDPEEERAMRSAMEGTHDDCVRLGLAHDLYPRDLAASSYCRGVRRGHTRQGYGNGLTFCVCGESLPAQMSLPTTPNRRFSRWRQRRARRQPMFGRCIHGHGTCLRCLTTWCRVDYHGTEYSAYTGIFPLCELCWRELSPEERLPFYRELFVEHWLPHHQEGEWAQIERAVLAGN